MKLLGKILLHTLRVVPIVYILLCLLIYFFQEKILFQLEKLPENYKFQFKQPYEELFIKAKDGVLLNGLLFTTDSSKGLIFYLHGNAGSLSKWGGVADTYTALGYDIFILDYRGYGISEGSISSEKQMFEDVQSAYDTIKRRYPENKSQS